MSYTRYFFEKDGKWLTKDWSMTDDPNKAIAVKERLEADLFLIGRQKQGLLEVFKVTEHEFVDN
jgi:hypothetical protein